MSDNVSQLQPQKKPGLGKHIAADKLRYVAARPTFYSLEMHLALMLREALAFRPDVFVLDPLSAFTETGNRPEVHAMLLRIVDFLKSEGITGVLTHLTQSGQTVIETESGLSSLMDAWILLLNRESNGEFNRELYLLKARGLRHSNQVREFVMDGDGIHLVLPYTGRGQALTGAARRVAEAEEQRQERLREIEAQKAQHLIEQRRRRALAQIEVLRSELEADEAELRSLVQVEEDRRSQIETDEAEMRKSRGN